MKRKNQTTSWLHKIIRIVIATLVLLLIPFLAGKASDSIVWNTADYVAAAFLLIAASIGIELVLAKTKGYTRNILAVIIILVAVLCWAEIAVGVFGSPIHGN